MPEEEGEPEGIDLEDEAITEESTEEAAPVEEAPEEIPDEEEDEELVMANGGTEVVDLNVPEPMLRYMVALQRTPPDREVYYEDDGEGASDDEGTVQRPQEIDPLAI